MGQYRQRTKTRQHNFSPTWHDSFIATRCTRGVRVVFPRARMRSINSVRIKKSNLLLRNISLWSKFMVNLRCEKCTQTLM